jgi:predicted N-acetyltransferase YhbS
VSFVVRVAEAGEYAAPLRITADGYRADDLLRRTDGLIDFYYEAQLTDASRRAREAELLVAVDDGQVLGTVTWCPPSSRGANWPPTQTRRSSGCSRSRRRGVGRALVNACLDRARAQGMREVLISSLPQMTAAHALYREFGFVRAPELDHSPKPQVHLSALQLNLPL